MENVGVVVEYNPFHNGHMYHLNKSREITGARNVIAVMSGNFVQRGQPAIADKHLRARMALLHGADIVLELPVYFACASAEYFAFGSIAILEKTGIVDCLCFGSEGGDIEKLEAVSKVLEQEGEEYKQNLKTYLDKGMPYPAAVSAAADLPEEMKEPNQLLGIFYLLALKRLGSKIHPFTVKRIGSGYHDTAGGEYASASAVRLMLAKNDGAVSCSVPEDVFNMLSSAGGFVDVDDFSSIFQYLIKTASPERLNEILDMEEGLENRFLRYAGEAHLLSEIIKRVKTKRHVYTRLQRAAMHLLLDIRKEEFHSFLRMGGPQYIRVLGFRKEKAWLLRDMEKRAKLPMVTNLKHAEEFLNEKGLRMLQKEIFSTDVYYSAKKNTHEKNHEYRTPLVIV